jgi:hypothetical protein
VSIFLGIAVSIAEFAVQIRSIGSDGFGGDDGDAAPVRRSLYDSAPRSPTVFSCERLGWPFARWRNWTCCGRFLGGMAMRVLRILVAVALAGALMGCGQGQPGPKGDPGPPGSPGPKGDPGPPGSAFGIRIIRSNCDATNCSVQCAEDELLLTAYCGARRNAAVIPSERSATCRSPVPANSPLVAACVKIPPQ